MEYGALSLLPPLVAIVLAIATRRVIAPLALGVFVAVFLLRDENAAWWQTGYDFVVAIWESISAKDHLQALAFSLLLGAMVGVLEIGGAMKSLVSSLARRIKTRKGAQTLIATSGLAIFFDDYANTLLVGGTMRGTADRYGISRSKLAYLVDSTAAPVAGLSVISTWAATEISYMVDGLKAAGVTDPAAGFELFLRSIPYRFYPCLALVMVFLVARSGRDFGPMKAAEQKAADECDELASKEDADGELKGTRARHSWVPTILPVLVCILTVILALVYTGYQSVGSNDDNLSWWRYVGLVIGNGDSYFALILGGGAGWLSTLVGHRIMCRSSATLLARGSVKGVGQMLPAMLILWFAWALSSTTGENALDTGGYLANMLSDALDPRFLPTLVFLIAGLMSFSTGTSWGTMAILTPLSVTLALSLESVVAGGGNPDPASAICLTTCGSVLAGAIFGDHCSPISDTTVLSSRASGCDHVEHVRTQMPYALVVGVVCIAVGCIPAAMGLSPWISLAAGTAILWGILIRFGAPVA